MTMTLIVLAEHGSSGIWRREPNGISEVEYEEIHLPPELSQHFKDWIELYAVGLPASLMGSSSRKSAPIPLDQFNAIGRNLAQELKAFVEPDVVVEYAPRTPRDTGGPPETIE